MPRAGAFLDDAPRVAADPAAAAGESWATASSTAGVLRCQRCCRARGDTLPATGVLLEDAPRSPMTLGKA